MQLGAYLEEQNLTKAGFARIIGVSRTMVSSLACGKRCPSLTMTRKIEFATKGQVTAFDFYPNSFPAYQTGWPFLEAEASSIAPTGNTAPMHSDSARKQDLTKYSEL